VTRPLFHLTPPAGFLGDPNGLIHWQGSHHVFYQWNPVATAFGRMHWGHAVSSDLLRWEHRPVALVPGATDALDGTGCWSGGAALTAHGEVELFYTAVSDGAQKQRPRVARTTDPGLDSLVPGALVATPPDPAIHDFRDPFVWWHEGQRHLILAAVLPDGQPSLLVYTERESSPGADWEYAFALGRDALPGVPGRLWECPSVIKLDGRWVAMLSVIEGEGAAERLSVWAVTLDREPGQQARPLWVGRLDAGPRYYAALPWQHADGRWLQLGWLRTQDDPDRGVSTWVGAMSCPRELTLVGDRVVLRPAAELDDLVRTPLGRGHLGSDRAIALGDPGLRRDDDGLRAGNSPTQLEIVAITPSTGTLILEGPEAELMIPIGELVEPESSGEVRIFIDAGLIEAFGPLGARSDTSSRIADLVSVSPSDGAGISEVNRLSLADNLPSR